jgi:mono/diheme cytochrome c family protein
MLTTLFQKENAMRVKFFTIGIAIVVTVVIWQVQAAQEPTAKQKSGRDDASLRKHGDYLVNAAIVCGDCHTSQDDQGKPDRTRLLRGTILPIQPKKEIKNWAEESPDITGSGLAGMWSEEEMVKFLTTGIDPDGKKAKAPMPAFRLSASDARAVFLYLKTLPGPKEGQDREKRSKDSK